MAHPSAIPAESMESIATAINRSGARGARGARVLAPEHRGESKRRSPPSISATAPANVTRQAAFAPCAGFPCAGLREYLPRSEQAIVGILPGPHAVVLLRRDLVNFVLIVWRTCDVQHGINVVALFRANKRVSIDRNHAFLLATGKHDINAGLHLAIVEKKPLLPFGR